MDHDRYIFRTHSRLEIEEWATSLQYFRFCRAYGGHNNDGDHFLVAFRYEGENDLLDLLGKLGVEPEYVSENHPKPIPGVRYSADDFSEFISTVKEIPTVKQPEYKNMLLKRAFLWAENGKLTISISDKRNSYEVTEESYLNAKTVETAFSSISSRIIEPPQDDKYCICPKYYPEIWEYA